MGSKDENRTKKKKGSKKHKVKNGEGETLKQQDKMKKENTKYYKALLKAKQTITPEEQH